MILHTYIEVAILFQAYTSVDINVCMCINVCICTRVLTCVLPKAAIAIVLIGLQPIDCKHWQKRVTM